MPGAVTRDARSLKRILGSRCCSGCGLCAGLSGDSIEMAMSDDGFLRPHQLAPLSPDADQLIADTCPGIKLTQPSQEGSDHVLWGPIVDVRTGASTDASLRRHASSGGVLSGLLLHLLDSGAVDYIVQTTASETAPLGNRTVISRSREDVYRAAGSRYAPSAPLENIHHYLERPGRFAFVAKPCDIAALRAFAHHDPRIDEKIPVMLSFFCAGIPSIKGAKQILNTLGVEEKDVVRFRYRGNGWPGRATATLRNGRKAEMSYAASWGDILSKHVQFRCKICPDGSGGFADIVCADAWHCDEAGYPLFEEQDGRSLIVSRTGLGERLVQGAIAAGLIVTEPLDVGEIENMQPSQARRKRLVLSRMAAMLFMGRSVSRFHGLNLVPAARSAGLWPNIKSFLGMARRVLLGRQ